MKKRPMNAGSASCALPAFAAVAAFVLIGAASANSAEPTADNIGIQQARAKRVQERAAKPHYTKRWNLDDLPAYVPEQQVSGSLRIWGTNYLTDGMLNE